MARNTLICDDLTVALGDSGNCSAVFVAAHVLTSPLHQHLQTDRAELLCQCPPPHVVYDMEIVFYTDCVIITSMFYE